MPETQEHTSQFGIQVEGLDETAAASLLADVVEITVESSLHLPDVATIVLHDSWLRWVDDKRLDPGKGIKLSARPSDGDEQPLFDGEIVELEPEFGAAATHMVVRAFDRLHRLSRGRFVRSFLNVTDGDLVQKIAKELGLKAEVGSTSQVHPYVFQNNESNLDFLRGRAAALGYVLFADGKTLHFDTPKSDGDPVELKWPDTLKEFRPRMTTLDQVTMSTVRGWDPATRQEILGQVKNGNGLPQIGEQRKPGQLTQAAFSLEAPFLIADRPIRSQAAAERLAQATVDRLSGRFLAAEGRSTGNSKIVAGSAIKLVNVGERFSGTYLVSSARHVYTREAGYVTHFEVSGREPATLLNLLTPEPPGTPTTGLVPAIVTDNADPEGLGRVKVKYPWLSPDHASHWARVVSVGGGPSRGIQFVPEINDEVLVGFELGDVHHPYVLGGLWNGKDPPPGEQGKVVSGGKVQRRIIRSRTGHTITLDDQDGAGGITVEDRKGNIIVLESGSDALKIKVKGDATIEAQGNLTLKAQGRVEINAQAGVKIDGGVGTVDVKGTVINLN
jgi:phage protein D